jgi:SAM-dependent methyltransferase
MTQIERPLTPTEKTASGEYTMSSITGKLVLAMIRGSDYAHAGEEEAIDLVLGPLEKTPSARFLDVGCGIGGTARYVQAQGWGNVTGVDIDPDNIAAATERHPGIEFLCSDAAVLNQHVAPSFDVIYSLNAFFLFDDQPAALQAMRSVANSSARLAIFDYVDLGGYAQWQPHRKTPGLRRALQLDLTGDTLRENGWDVDEIVPAHAEYLRWYETLVHSIEAKHEAIVAQSSEGFFEYVRTRYTETRDDVQAGRLGGATIYATAS